MSGQSNIDNVRMRIMALESATVFDNLAWQCVFADLRAAGRLSALSDAERRMETARTNSVGGVDWADGMDKTKTKLVAVAVETAIPA